MHVCTPPSTHVAIAEEGLRSGVSVLIEKPPCLSLAEYDRIETAERAGGAYASVVFQHRFGSAGLHAARLLGEGEFGRPLVALCNTTWYRSREYFDVPWRGLWRTEGGGPTMSHGIHQMDLLLALLGDWLEVTAFADRADRDVETEDVSVACVRFESGALASITNSVLSPREESYLRIDTVDATIEVSHLYGYSNDDWLYTPAPHVTDRERVARWSSPPADEPSSHRQQLIAVLDSMDRGERPATSGADGRRALELVTAIYQSVFTRSIVRRESLTPGSPFYSSLNGDVFGWGHGQSAGQA
jgi:predicted dehydrogenase